MCEILKFSIVAVSMWIVCEAQVDSYFSDNLNPNKVDLSVWHQRNPRVAVQTSAHLNCEKPNIYICEEPPNQIPFESTKTCNFRNVWYHEQVFRWVAGRGCLFYTPSFLYEGGSNPIRLNASCVYGNLFAPCLEIAKEDGTCGCFPFDPSFEEIVTAVRRAMVTSAHGRFENCYYAASDCCSHYMNGDWNEPGTNRCSPTFDGWTCWDSAKNGTTASAVCSEFAYSNSGPSCLHFSSKECHPNGTWELQTDYSTCSITPRLLRRYRFYIAMLTFSVVACLPAIIIFLFYKRLRVIRVALHRNLLIAIVLRNVLVIISRNEIYIDELTNAGDTIMSQHGVACRVLAIAERVATNAVFVCMLVEGIYLHRLIVAVFKKKLNMKLLYIVGAILAILPTVAWSVIMSQYNDHSCWMVYTVDNVQWILDAPRILILGLNTVLFVDVLRVLLTKIRNSENTNQLNKTKATLFLMPIFGVQFIFTAIRPRTTDCLEEQIYYFVAYTIEGLQGLIVALLYCYVNKEVHILIKGTYKKTENAITSKIKGSNYPRISTDPNTDRRNTYSTGVNTNNIEESKSHYSTMKPKLHVAEIISIQASERLAEILDPVYETIDNSLVNNGYDYLERSDIDNDSGFIPNRNSKIDEYYGFTNASSISIGCPEWLRCASSPASSIYNSSLARDVSSKELARDKNNDTLERANALMSPLVTEDENPPQCYEYANVTELLPEYKIMDIEKSEENSMQVPRTELHDEKCENMLDEIMECMKSKSNDTETTVIKLNPDLLSPNRPDGEKIIFVDD